MRHIDPALYLALSLLTLLLPACGEDGAGGWSDTDLLPYGIPLTIQAPDSLEVDADDMVGTLRDITLKGGEDYNLQIFASDAVTNDVSQLKADQLATVKELRYFSRVVEEEENGFLFEYLIEQDNPTYSFRYIVVQGDKEYLFQPGLSAMYSLEEARRLYQAVKPTRR